MRGKTGRRWALAWLAVLTVAGATVSLAAPASLADGCNSPSRDADLSLIGSAAPAGSNVNYTINVTNNGPDCTNGVAATVQLAPGSTYVGFVGSDRTWLCSGGNVVSCTLQSTLPSPPGKNVTFFTIAATPPSSPSDASIHASVTSSALVDPPTNNEAWITFGKVNTAGNVSGSHPQARVIRVDSQSIATTLTDLAGWPPAPQGYSFQTDRAIDVTTPAAPGNSKKQALLLVITFNAPSKPGAFVFHLNHQTNTWEVVNAKCGPNGPFPSIDSVSFDSGTGIATITVCTLHFSHFSK